MKVTIDNITLEVEPGTTIMQAARMIGPEIAPPAMCYYEPLKGTGGKCRGCLVKVTAGSEKDPRPMPKLVPSCITTVQDGMIVENTINEQVLETRKGIVEFLLLNHPLDCPVCDQAGECHLQDFSFEHGVSSTRTVEDRNTFEPVDLGPYIKLNMNRCILCYRCVYAADQLTEGRVHGVMHRGDHAEISTYIEKAIDNDFSGNVIDVCPVGALTDRTYRFKSRVWFSKPEDAHCDCDKCSGNVTLWYRGDEVIRVTGRKNEWGEVKEFICNTCRFERKKTSDWVIEGPTKIARHSVISANKYGANLIQPSFSIKQAALAYKLIDDDRDRSFLPAKKSLPSSEKK
ncbi:2Fe-2S iron-sulfur cluster binding domain-containing protein [Cytophagaceae bacterium 50C-KIRBA]|uniref:2Fe-2S iron-sulfur cluster binding domain-containing protein n=1 Tax=Aquirufa beregesia TaxID=2516556 RepID=A0ABX0EYP7_9BACT|nr:2Fe-2S iron-sulfur cluster-binding protein [Aquirufa beregesia]NGZ45233.1 2Fe-2S iron-sulfur cluster binding domain-containing protein [Aquirufa beregesia]